VEQIFRRQDEPASREEARRSLSAGSSSGGFGSDLRRAVEEAADRVEEIVGAAERVAAEIVAEAHAEADRHLEQRRRDAERMVEERAASLTRFTELLAERGNRLEARAQAMVAELEETAILLARLKEGIGRMESPPEQGPHEADERRLDAPTARIAAGAEGQASESAVLHAAQMAVVGSSRDQIAGVLRSTYGIGDPDPILDEILGSERG